MVTNLSMVAVMAGQVPGASTHAQSQVHRFLNTIGGYTATVNSYSAGAGEVIVPRILGMSFRDVMFEGPTLEDIAQYTKLVVCFGGIALKNTSGDAGRSWWSQC